MVALALGCAAAGAALCAFLGYFVFELTDHHPHGPGGVIGVVLGVPTGGVLGLLATVAAARAVAEPRRRVALAGLLLLLALTLTGALIGYIVATNGW